MIDEGMEVNYPADMAPFKEATKAVHEEYVGSTIDQELYNKTLEILNG